MQRAMFLSALCEGSINPAASRLTSFGRFVAARGSGSIWTWVGIDTATTLCISYLVRLRDGFAASGS